MPLLIFKILVISTSLLAWSVLTITGICMLRNNRHNRKKIFPIAILLVLWGIFSYNSWYEGLFLFKKIALFPSLNSWSFTLLTPLFYLYFRSRMTNQLQDIKHLILHLILPGILAGIYTGLILFNPISDKLIYSWSEVELNNPEWWIYFRIGCYLFLAVQLSIYLPHLFNIYKKNDRSIPQTRLIQKELLYILYFYLVSIVSMFTPSYFCNILYNLSVTLAGVYLLKQSFFYLIIKRKIGFYLQPHSFIVTDTEQTRKGKVPILLTPEEEKQLDKLLKSPRILHDPSLTLKILASELGKNVTLLSRYFNLQLGVSFPEYVTGRRLDEAEVLLKNSDINVIEISELVGFQTSSTFYQAFNIRHNLPPSQWRKKIRDNSL